MSMNLSEQKGHGEVVRERRKDDPEYAAEADRLALASEVSLALVHYRSEHGLTQTEFGAMLGWKQPHVARLERGDVAPSIETLQRLARAGVIEVHIDQQGSYVQNLATA